MSRLPLCVTAVVRNDSNRTADKGGLRPDRANSKRILRCSRLSLDTIRAGWSRPEGYHRSHRKSHDTPGNAGPPAGHKESQIERARHAGMGLCFFIFRCNLLVASNH